MRQHIVHTHPSSPSSTYASKSKTPDTTPCRISYASRKTGGTPTRELTYKVVYPINPTEARNKIVQTYLQTGSKGAEPCASPAKRHDAGTPPPQRVRQWVQHDPQHGEQGNTAAILPHHPHQPPTPHQTPSQNPRALERRHHPHRHLRTNHRRHLQRAPAPATPQHPPPTPLNVLQRRRAQSRHPTP